MRRTSDRVTWRMRGFILTAAFILATVALY